MMAQMTEQMTEQMMAQMMAQMTEQTTEQMRSSSISAKKNEGKLLGLKYQSLIFVAIKFSV